MKFVLQQHLYSSLVCNESGLDRTGLEERLERAMFSICSTYMASFAELEHDDEGGMMLEIGHIYFS